MWAFAVLNAPVRVISIDGQPWFPAKDVCDLLGIKQPAIACRALVDGQKQTIARSKVDSAHVSFPNRGMLCINEGGLYKLLFVSRKPEALAFQDWVTDHVLPAIRKDGMYVAGEEKVATGELTIEQQTANVLQYYAAKVERQQKELAAVTAERDATLQNNDEMRVVNP